MELQFLFYAHPLYTKFKENTFDGFEVRTGTISIYKITKGHFFRKKINVELWFLFSEHHLIFLYIYMEHISEKDV